MRRNRGKTSAAMLAASVVAAGLLSPAPSAGQKTEPDFEILRKSMVRTQLRSRDINDEKVLRAMEAVPRHLFVLPATRARAYEDYPLPIEEGQTISQPYIVALMTQLLELRGGERVLEVGTGSGYQAAVLSKIVAEVFTIEYFPSLARSAAERLKALGFTNVEVRAGDGFFGWPEKAPFGAIIVTAAASRIPAPLVDQLKEGGRLVLPVENAEGVQTLTRVTKIGGKTKVEPISLVRFVPLLGEDKKKK